MDRDNKIKAGQDLLNKFRRKKVKSTEHLPNQSTEPSPDLPSQPLSQLETAQVELPPEMESHHESHKLNEEESSTVLIQSDEKETNLTDVEQGDASSDPDTTRHEALSSVPPPLFSEVEPSNQKDKNIELLREYSNLKQEFEKLEKDRETERDELMRALDEQIQRADALDAKYLAERQQHETLKLKVNDVKCQLEENQAENRKLNEKVKAEERQREKANDELTKTKAAKQDVENRLELIQNENLTLRKTIEELNSKSVQAVSAQDEVKLIQAKVKQLVETVETQSKNMNALKQQLEATNAEKSRLQEELSKIDNSKHESSSTIQSLQQEITALKKQLSITTNEKIQLQDSVTKRDSSVTELQKEITALMSQKAALVEASHRVLKLEQELKISSESNNRAQETIRLFQEERKKMLETSDESQHIVTIKKELLAMKEKNALLETDHKQQTELVAQMKQAKLEYDETMARLRSDLQTKFQENNNLSHEVALLKQHLAGLETSQTSKLTRIAQLENENASLNSQLSCMTQTSPLSDASEVEKVKEKYQTRFQELTEIMKSHETQVENWRKKFNEVTQQLDLLKEEKKTLSETVKKLLKQLAKRGVVQQENTPGTAPASKESPAMDDLKRLKDEHDKTIGLYRQKIQRLLYCLTRFAKQNRDLKQTLKSQFPELTVSSQQTNSQHTQCHETDNEERHENMEMERIVERIRVVPTTRSQPFNVHSFGVGNVSGGTSLTDLRRINEHPSMRALSQTRSEQISTRASSQQRDGQQSLLYNTDLDSSQKITWTVSMDFLSPDREEMDVLDKIAEAKREDMMRNERLTRFRY